MVFVRVMVRVRIGLWLQLEFDPNNLLTLTPRLTIIQTLNTKPPN